MQYPERRPYCDRCLRPKHACFCGKLKPVEPGFDLVILQHPKERKKTTASARIAYLGVQNASLVQGVELDAHPLVLQRLDHLGNACVVLYPGPGAMQVDSEEGRAALREFQKERRLVVFVIDGTWSTARTLLYRSPRIAALPSIAFTPESHSEYGFKKQPAKYCLSTVEAVCQLIQMLGRDPRNDSMMSVFREMVQRQLAYTDSD